MSLGKSIMKWIGDHHIESLDMWPGNSLELNSIEKLWSVIKRRADEQKTTKL